VTPRALAALAAAVAALSVAAPASAGVVTVPADSPYPHFYGKGDSCRDTAARDGVACYVVRVFDRTTGAEVTARPGTCLNVEAQDASGRPCAPEELNVVLNSFCNGENDPPPETGTCLFFAPYAVTARLAHPPQGCRPGPVTELSTSLYRGTAAELNFEVDCASYSLVGTCGRFHGRPRCHLLLGLGTVAAIKSGETEFASLIAPALDRILGDAFAKAAASKVRTAAITYLLKRFASAGAARAFGALSIGNLMGRIASLAFLGARWSRLGQPGYPPKCFQAVVTLESGGPTMALEPIWSFVRAWDPADPPNRPRTTSLARWPDASGEPATLPMFCRGPNATAVTTGWTSGVDSLLKPPFVTFSVDFRR
jgi:hypothetical protein